MPSEEFTLKALDGRPLSATLHAPREAPQAVLVVLGALGVPRRYYAPLASWLAERDIAGPTGLLPINRSTWWAWIKADRAPRPVKLGPRISAWRVEDIRALLAEFEGRSA